MSRAIRGWTGLRRDRPVPLLTQNNDKGLDNQIKDRQYLRQRDAMNPDHHKPPGVVPVGPSHRHSHFWAGGMKKWFRVGTGSSDQPICDYRWNAVPIRGALDRSQVLSPELMRLYVSGHPGVDRPPKRPARSPYWLRIMTRALIIRSRIANIVARGMRWFQNITNLQILCRWAHPTGTVILDWRYEETVYLA